MEQQIASEMSNKTSMPITVFKHLLSLFYNDTGQKSCEVSSSSPNREHLCAIYSMKSALQDLAVNDSLGEVKLRVIMNMIDRYSLRLLEPEEEPCGYCDGVVGDVLSAYNNIHGYISLFVCVLGTFSNILNIAVLTRKDMASAPINRILKWLAVTDMFVMLEYVPFAVYRYLIFPQNMDYPKPWAIYLLFHVNFSQILHTTSISLTLSLAIWRYIAIKYPHLNNVLCTSRRCIVALLSSFILPFILCIPNYLLISIHNTTLVENGVNHTHYHLDADYDGPLWLANFWIHAVLIKLLPCFFLTIISIWLINALYSADKRKTALKMCNRIAGTSQETSLDRRQFRRNQRTDRTTKMLVAILILFLITELPQGILGLMSGIIGKCFFKTCYHLFGELMDILALINGAINFILYCTMSKQFRVTFGMLFKPKILGRWPTNGSQTEVQSTCV